MSYSQQIQDAIDHGYNFKTGEYFSKGWEYFKLRPLEYVGYFVIFIVLSLVLSIIPIVGTIVTIIITPALTVGIPIFTNMLARDENPEFGNFFDGFKKLTPLLVAYVLTLVIYGVISLPMIFMVGFSVIGQLSDASGDPEATMEAFQMLASMGIWFVLFMLIFMYVAVSLRWTLLLVYFHGFDAVEAIKTSWKLTNKKWLSHLGFVILGGLLVIAGVFALFVGLLVTAPLYYAADQAGFADVTGLNASDELDSLGDDQETV